MTASTDNLLAPADPLAARAALCEQITGVVALHPHELQPILVALVAGGHVLIEGVPGIGKTLLARTIAASVDCGYRRIQFTNDLMPSDIVGTSIWRPQAEQFEFVEGPLFTNLVLADEINRTSPRTLSCLLEAMENGTVSVDGQARQLGDPFFVLATRNPIEFHGTYPVPEAALDRFLVRTELGYPDDERELQLYQGRNPLDALDELRPVITRDELRALRLAATAIEVREPIARYALRIAQATRTDRRLQLGASPRAALAWLAASRAHALLDGRQYVLPDDLQSTARFVLPHRLFAHGSENSAEILDDLLQRTPVEL